MRDRRCPRPQREGLGLVTKDGGRVDRGRKLVAYVGKIGARPVSTYCHSEIGDPPEILLLISRHVVVDIRTRGLVLPSLLPSDLCDGLSVSRGEQRRSAAGLRICD